MFSAFWAWVLAHPVEDAIILALLGIAITIWAKWRSDKAFRELKEEIKKLQERPTLVPGRDTEVTAEKPVEHLASVQQYLDGIPKVRKRRKAVIYRDAFRAMREYRHDEAIKKFQEAYPLASDDSERCAILNLIGTDQINSSAYKDAEQTFLEMIEIAEQAKLDDVLSAAYGNIGVVYRTLGEPHKALEYHEKALEINEKIGRLEGQATNLGNIGIVYDTLGEPHRALGYYQKALKIAEQIGNLEIQASILGNIGNVYGNMGDHQKALEFFQRAREIFVKIGAKLEIEKADRNIALARQKLAEQ